MRTQSHGHPNTFTTDPHSHLALPPIFLLCAKPPAKISTGGGNYLEYLRKIRHFSNSNLSIFNEYAPSRHKNMRFFLKSALFCPEKP